MNTAVTASERDEEPDLGINIKRLRRSRGWNLSRLAKESGLPQSTLSKVEAGQMSLNYQKLLQLADALQIDVRSLFATPSEIAIADGNMARRAVDRASPTLRESEHGHYRHLSTELKNRLMIPILFEVDYSDGDITMMNLMGERFAYVVEGPVDFHCEQYETVTLETGDSIYVDAAMPHAFVAPTKDKTPKVITVLTSSNLEYLDLARDAASRGSADASERYIRRSKREKTKVTPQG